jgi:hypothetical protein
METKTKSIKNRITISPLIFTRSIGGWYLNFRTVNVQNICPRCGQERGAIRNERFYEDDTWYNVDRWDNKCGHTDKYVNVLYEHHLHNSDVSKMDFKEEEPGDYALPHDTVIKVDNEIRILEEGTEVTMYAYFIGNSDGNRIPFLKGIYKGDMFITVYTEKILNNKKSIL